MAPTNVKATGVNTIEWLAKAVSSLAVPVYQRHYRWDVDRCSRLLDDIRSVADAGEGQTHFIGSVLATPDSGDAAELTLVDGQQRVTTLMLLAAALHNAAKASAAAVAAELRGVLVHPTRERTTKLLPHKSWDEFLGDIVFDGGTHLQHPEESPFVENYAFFARAVQGDWERVWRGLRRIEHVSILLAESAKPQQVFESLNSTGVPLKNHELVHNYLLMGLSHAEQNRIENGYWASIEQNTGEHVESFLRDYLIQRTGRDSEFTGEHGVYRVFKKEFSSPTAASLAVDAAEWKALSEVYGVLLFPAKADDHEIAEQLAYVNVFGSAMYPFLMPVYRDYLRAFVTKDVILETLERLQSLFLRKMLVGESRDHLAAQLCRSLKATGDPLKVIARRIPSNERIRNALKYRALPHAGYVLQRLEGIASLEGLEIEHIFPQSPTDTWSGGGDRPWASFTADQRSTMRALLQTIGNLALLEKPLNAGASNRAFPDKKAYYLQSGVSSTKALAFPVTTSEGERPSVWDANALEARTHQLTERFLQVWEGPQDGLGEDVADLVPIIDARKKPGWYRGWRNEFEYVRFHGETWEVHDVKVLYNRVFRRLWDTHRPGVLAYSTPRDGPVFATRAWESQWDALSDSHYLFMGLIPQYMLGHVQRVLEAVGLADDVYLKYSSADDEVN